MENTPPLAHKALRRGTVRGVRATEPEYSMVSLKIWFFKGEIKIPTMS